MVTSPTGIALIKQFEGLKLEAYLDTGGVATIGYGTTRYPHGLRVKLGDSGTLEQAELWLREDIAEKGEEPVNRLVKQILTQNQFDALVSFTYNVGATAFKNSTLLKKVNDNPLDREIKKQFLRWNKDNGKVIKGLSNRRTSEAELYFK